MKTIYLRRTVAASVVVLAGLVAGCASVAVTNDAIEKLKKRIERAKKREEFYAKEFEKYDAIFKGYYDKLYR